MSGLGKQSTTSLLSDAIMHVSALVREEINLAKAEVNENLNRAAIAVGLLVGAVVIALTALDVLAAALVVALMELGLSAGWAAPHFENIWRGFEKRNCCTFDWQRGN